MLIADPIAFHVALARERELLEAIRSGSEATGEAAVRWLVWRTNEAIVVPRGLPSRAFFPAAKAAAETRGFPVHERDTGGDLTPQEPGVVNLSMAFCLTGADASIANAYQRLTAPVIDFLADVYTIEARTAAIPGAFCDGAFNIAVGERKLGGTAQRWKLLGGEGPTRRVAVLAHVALMASNVLEPAIDALNAFYAASGTDRQIDAARHVTLAGLIGRKSADASQVAEALARFMTRYCR